LFLFRYILFVAAFRFLLDQMSNGHLGWANVRDDFDTVILVEGDGSAESDLKNMEKAISSGVPLKSKQVSYMSGEKETIASLVAAFPGEKAAIHKYFKILASVRKATLGFVSLKFMPKWLGNLLVQTGLIYFMSDWFKYASTSTGAMIASITRNPTLRAVLAYNFGDYGTIPRDSPFSMHAVLQNHFLKGVSFPVGGSSEIAFNIVPTILRAGGAVFVRAEVDQIVLDDAGKKAVGVKMKRDGRVIRAPVVVSAAGICNTV
jgi:all-trans-retinol 13,14-reductase